MPEEPDDIFPVGSDHTAEGEAEIPEADAASCANGGEEQGEGAVPEGGSEVEGEAVPVEGGQREEEIGVAGAVVTEGESLLQPCTNCATLLDVGDLEPFAKVHCPICGTAMRAVPS